MEKIYKGPFCCLDMDLMLENEDDLYNVNYDAAIREYYLKSLQGPYIRTIEFCPWCGVYLMKNLRDEWYDIIRNELQLEPHIPKERKNIPKEFLTDEWWKKRRL